MNVGNLFVKFDNCIMYDVLDLKICYRCSRLNHYQKTSNENVAYPKCLKRCTISHCKSTILKCIHCVDESNHATWNTCKYPIYKQKLEQYKSLFAVK